MLNSEIQCMYSGIDTIINVSSDVVERLYKDCLTLRAEDIQSDWRPLENSFVVVKNGSSHALATIQDERLVHVRDVSAYGIKARNVEQVFAIDALLNVNIPLVTVTGVAGTGKTLLAIAAAIDKRKFYKKILISRPIMPMGKDVGYLPGSLSDKISPYMSPLVDNVEIIKENGDGKAARVIEGMFETEKIVVEPLTYIRGRSISKSFLIVDEAQNLTAHEIKTIVTRAGEGTKIVFTGDTEQIDNPRLSSRDNGLTNLIDKFKGQGLYAHVHLLESERSPLARLAGELL